MLFGTEVHPWTMQETLGEIDRRLRTVPFTQHVVVNVAKIVTMQSDNSLKGAVSGCDIVNIDGAGVVFGGRLLGHEIPERVAGIDLFRELLGVSQESGRSVFFLGAKPEILEQAVQCVRHDFPQLEIAGYHHGYFWEDEKSVVDEIRRSGAELLFVGISSPMKEKFINAWRDELGVKFAMGVGGTFDVVAGKVRRAPKWMQQIGLEWLFRVIQEPRRMFMRYLTTNSKFAWMLLKELVARPFNRSKGGPAS
jgi:N-acetylglucosaminyldiphosphoundecaprenol N-acetyl-beta-D-mannosaminyltransferase